RFYFSLMVDPAVDYILLLAINLIYILGSVKLYFLKIEKLAVSVEDAGRAVNDRGAKATQLMALHCFQDDFRSNAIVIPLRYSDERFASLFYHNHLFQSVLWESLVP